MKHFLTALLTAVIAAASLQAQPQKQIPLGGGFVLNTKMPLAMSDLSLNELFPIKMEKKTPFLPVIRSANKQKQQAELPAKKEQVRTICGEWVDKNDSLISVYKGRDWYIQKSSPCAKEYYLSWKKQQDLSFIQQHQKRLQCEKQLKNNPSPVDMHICPVCGKPIDGRCGAIATFSDENGKKHYAHADCKAQARFDSQSHQLQELLGITAFSDEPRSLTATSAYLSQQAKNNALSKLKKISIPAAATQTAPATVSKKEMDAFISQNAQALNRAAFKQREGKELSAKDREILTRFEALRQGYNASNSQFAQQEAYPVRINFSAKPSKRQKKVFHPDEMTPAAPVHKPAFPVENVSVGAGNTTVEAENPVQNEGVAVSQQPVEANTPHGATPVQKSYWIVSKKMITQFKRDNKQDMLMIETLATSGAKSSDPLLNSKAQLYKTLTDSYQYLQTPQGKAALARVQAFEKQHKDQINIIRQWATYSYPQDIPEGFKPLVNEYNQILKEGNLRF